MTLTTSCLPLPPSKAGNRCCLYHRVRNCTCVTEARTYVQELLRGFLVV